MVLEFTGRMGHDSAKTQEETHRGRRPARIASHQAGTNPDRAIMAASEFTA
jgi:hypothetical protein